MRNLTANAAALWLAFSLPAAGFGAPQGEQKLLDAVVAVVNERIVTLSDVEIEARVIVVKRFGYGALPEEIDDELRSSVLEYIVNQEVILTEAVRLDVAKVENAEVDKEMESFISLFPDRKAFDYFLASGGISMTDLREIITRDLRVESYLQRKLKLLSWADEREVEKYYWRHSREFGDRPFEEVKEEARTAMLKSRSEKLLSKWLDDLKSKNDVRMLRDFK